MNAYRISRMTAGVTQERWAEMLGVSVESVRHWEAGDYLPSDSTVQMMAEISGYTILGLQHLRARSELARNEIPEVEPASLSEAVLRLLVAIKALQPQVDELLMIASDNRIDDNESEIFEQILDDLDDVVRAALLVKHSEKGEEKCSR